MAKDKLTQYDSVASNNLDVGGISIAEGMLPSNVNNAMREQMSHLADFAAGTSGVDVLKFQDDTDTNSIKIQAPASVTTTTTFTLPDGDGSANQSLVTNGSGTLSFSTRLANVVEDTTPQLGGNLDLNSNDITGTGDINITGTITSDGLTVEAGANTQTALGNADDLVIKNSGATGLSIFGGDGNSQNIYFGSTTQQTIARLDARYNAGAEQLYFHVGADNTPKLLIADTGDISFYDSTGVTQGLFWDASTQRLGLETTSPDGTLHVHSSSAGTVTAATDANQLVLESTANVGMSFLTGNTSTARIKFGDPDANNAGVISYAHSSNTMSFNTNGSQSMSIDSSGNLLVGKTSTSLADAGIVAYGGSSAGVVGMTNAIRPLYINKLTSDGGIIELAKDGTTVGSIGTLNADPWMARANGCGVRFITAAWMPTNATGNDSDNVVDLGQSGVRFDDIYATNGTIQTSDANEKQDIEALSDAEQRVAVAAKGLLRKYRWKSSVEEKGDDARIHFGIIAQDLKAAFEAEGLDAGRYGMFINSEWTDKETGEQRSRMGIRYNQLLAFIIAAI